MTITVGTTFEVFSGQTLNFTNESGFFLQESPPTPPPVLTVDGTVNVTITAVQSGSFPSFGGIQIGSSGFYDSTVTINAGGAFHVSSTVAGVSLWGFSSGSWSPDFVNHGTFTVSAQGDATGLSTWDAGPFLFKNDSVFQVTSTAGSATGVQMANGGDFRNFGDIEVSGHTHATAVAAAAHQESFDNTGVIHAVSDSAGGAVAVSWGFGIYTGGWSNEGQIVGDVALTASIYAIGPSSPISYVNSGLMRGSVQLSSGQDHFNNTGTVDGTMNLGIGDDQYDGRAGILTGALDGGDGADSIAGGAGAETLSGGLGSDTISGGGGADVLTGGLGAADRFIIGHGDSGTVEGATDRITDWISADTLDFGNLAGGHYFEATAASYAAALGLAKTQIAGGAADIVAVAVGGDVIVFADTGNDNHTADDAVVLQGQTLATIDATNIVTVAVSPPPPTDMTLIGGAGDDLLVGGAGNDEIRGGDGGADTLEGGAGNDFIVAGRGACLLHGGDGADTLVAVYNNAEVNGGAGDDFIRLDGMYSTDPVHLTRLDGGDGNDSFLVYAFPGQALTIDGGTGQNSLEMHYFGYETAPIILHLNGDPSGGAWVGAGLQTVTILNHLANVVGGDASETITAPGVIAGGGGDDVLTGSNPEVQDNIFTTMTLSGADTINGGLGDDTINGLSGQNYLRGDEGDDSIAGGSGFDDSNGNMGNDTIHGNGGDDWSVGGKGDDLLFGDDGDDIVWGNLGNDTCNGGNGADQVRGGQGDDSLSGGASADYISGDRGADTESGGSGADVFHTFSAAGLDKVLDFNLAEGDRVMLDPGTTYSVSQVGSDTVIDMGGGNQMILVGVQLSTLTPGWIFLG